MMKDLPANLTNLSSAIRYHAETSPKKVYLFYKGNEYEYAQIDKLINQICHFYESLELKQGDIISVVLRNGIEYILFYLASLRYGTVFNPYPYTLEAKDITRYLSNINPKLVFCQERHYSYLKDLVKCSVYCVRDDFIAGLNFDVISWNDYEPSENSPACLYYSSGTTGNPKNILFSYKNMVATISSVVRGFKFDENDIHLIVLPLGHTASINYSFLPSTLCGATIVLSESFWKIRAQFWSLIQKYNVTYVEVVPSIVLALLNTPYSKNDYTNIDSLQFIGCGSSMLPLERQIQFEEKYGIKVANLYGLSETGPTHIDYPIKEGWEPGSIGVPLDVNEVKIVDDENRELVVGETGEIVIKGENVFIDYYGNRELYNQVVKNEYFWTGDLGYIDEKGKHYFVGRKKELIIKGGINISPDEIDEIFYKMNEVSEALSIGVYDEYLGEKIVSYVVLKKEYKVTADEILSHCRDFLSRDKIPDQIEFVENIPKGHSGKFLRKKLGSN